MPQTIASLYKFVEPVVRKYWGLGMEKHTAQYSQIFEVESTDEPIFDYAEAGGPGPLTLKQENERIQTDRIVQGVSKRIQANTYAGAIELSMELVEDAKYPAIKKAAASLGRSAAQTPEYLAAQFLDRAFNSSYPVMADQKELCSTTHTIPRGGTYANMLATPVGLSENALEQIMTNLAVMPWTDNMLNPLRPEKLVIPSALGPTAWKLNQTKYQVGSAANDLSYVAGAFKTVQFDYLTSNTRYFVTTNADDGLFWKWRKKAEFMRDNENLTLMAVFICYFRCLFGCVDGRQIYGVNAV